MQSSILHDNIEVNPKNRPTMRAATVLEVKADGAIFAACGWPSGLGAEEILERLLALNLERRDPSALRSGDFILAHYLSFGTTVVGRR